MENLTGYLHWRGDLSFSQSPLNEVDGLVFCYLAYVNLDGIVSNSSQQALTIEEVSIRFFERYTQKELDADRSLIRNAPYLMKEMAKTVRFGKLLVRNYVNEVSREESLQFSAIEIVLENGDSYIAYRGTDDTIVGWREDFNLSTGIIPAEREAAEYLERIARNTQGDLWVGGHSKGGNLAIYAAAECGRFVQKRIRCVQNYDGPGFHPDFYERLGIHRIQSRIVRYVPEFSLFGMLLEHNTEAIIVKSSQKGIMQHDGLSWQVEGTQFVQGRELDLMAVIFNESMQTWLSGIEDTERDQFVEEMFSVLEAPGCRTLSELQGGGIRSIRKMLQQMEKLNPQTREKVTMLLQIMMGHWGEFLQSKLLPRKG